jgi:hypothetical protein
MASGGFRLGGWDYLQWKHVFPINNENAKDGEVIAVLSQVSDMKEPRQIKKLSIFLLQ